MKPKLNVLILEDDYRLLAEWKAELEAAGFEVDIAPNYGRALPLLNRNHDCYIVDLFRVQGGEFLPDGGIRLLRDLKTYDRHIRSPLVVAVTGYYQDMRVDTATVAANLGASITLKKPLQPEKLVRIIWKWSKNSKTNLVP